MTPIEPNAIYSVAEACTLVGFGETFVRKEIKADRLKARRAGKKEIKIKGTDLLAWYDQLPSASTDTAYSGPKGNGGQPGTKKAKKGSLVDGAVNSTLK